jgi:hypothetical protein
MTTTFTIGGALTVNRLGYGAMRLPGARDLSAPVDEARAAARGRSPWRPADRHRARRRPRELRDEGKIRFAGVSEVTPDELRRARELIGIATVQNRFSLGEQEAAEVLRVCEADGIAFLPWAPVRMADLETAS